MEDKVLKAHLQHALRQEVQKEDVTVLNTLL